MKIIIMLCITSLFWACDKDSNVVINPPPPPEVEVDTAFDLQWATRMDFSKEIVNLSNGVKYREWYIYPGDLDDPPTIMAFNRVSGEQDWQLILEQIGGGEITYLHLLDNLLISRNSSAVFAIDLDSQELLWVKDFSSTNLRFDRPEIAKNGKYYLLASENFDPLGGFNELMLEFDPNTGEQKEIVKYFADNEGTKTMSPPVYVNNDIIIYNLYPNAEVPPQDGKQYLVAYDMISKQEVWRTLVTDVFASNSLHPPIIYQNLVITGGDWHMHAFDINTGEKVWKTEITDDSPFSIFTKTNHLIHNDRLYVNENGENVSCLNPATGELIWNNPKGGPNCTDNMVYYEKEDLLVFTSWGYGSVMVLDALTGETIHRENSYDNSPYNNDVVYDPETDMFFTSTYKHAVGFKVNRPE